VVAGQVTGALARTAAHIDDQPRDGFGPRQRGRPITHRGVLNAPKQARIFDRASGIGIKSAQAWTESVWDAARDCYPEQADGACHVVAYDYGIKANAGEFYDLPQGHVSYFRVVDTGGGPGHSTQPIGQFIG